MDFDGLLLDTETADYRAWLSLYEAAGVPFPRDLWLQRLGGAGSATELYEYLGNRLRCPNGIETLWQRRRDMRDLLLVDVPLAPGADAFIRDARDEGLRLAIASNSTLEWVHRHLVTRGVVDQFDVICTFEMVDAPKPSGDVYAAALDALGICPDEAFALEDSAVGVAAAQAAGLITVGIPNVAVVGVPRLEADIVIPSLATVQFRDLVRMLTELAA